MSTKKIPEGYNTVTPYLILKNASQFIDFMTEVFEAEVTYKAMRDEKTIMHAELKIDDSKIMFADAGEQWKVQPAGLFIYVDEADVVYNKAKLKGAETVTPMADQSYRRSGGVKDPFGNTWWITSAE
jgi:PhnB protein